MCPPFSTNHTLSVAKKPVGSVGRLILLALPVPITAYVSLFFPHDNNFPAVVITEAVLTPE